VREVPGRFVQVAIGPDYMLSARVISVIRKRKRAITFVVEQLISIRFEPARARRDEELPAIFVRISKPMAVGGEFS
jgi:hypothetical protein